METLGDGFFHISLFLPHSFSLSLHCILRANARVHPSISPSCCLSLSLFGFNFHDSESKGGNERTPTTFRLPMRTLLLCFVTMVYTKGIRVFRITDYHPLFFWDDSNEGIVEYLEKMRKGENA